MKQSIKRVAGPFGLGAAACAACCAGLVLAFLGGLSLAGGAAFASGATFFGLALIVAAVAVLAVRRRRQIRARSCATSVPVAAPSMRSSTPT